MGKAKKISTDSGKVGTVEDKPKEGVVSIKFVKDFGSYKKDEVVKYHHSTANGLLLAKVCVIVK